MAKKRLDVLLFEKGLCPSRERAKTAIMEGIVYVAGQKAGKAGDMVDENAALEVRDNGNAFVSRGGKKIEKALDYFAIDPAGLTVMDVGASTGGFTDCLLRRGAVKVYSIDVGYGQLAWSLRQDPRVKCMERTNIRYVTPDMLEETPSLCVIDVSFISLRLVLPVVAGLLTESGRVACLIKPQFEAGRGKVGKKGVVREPEIHLEVLERFVENAHEAGFALQDVTFSPIKGPEGNIEFLGYLAKQSGDRVPICRRSCAKRTKNWTADWIVYEAFFHLSQYAQGGSTYTGAPGLRAVAAGGHTVDPAHADAHGSAGVPGCGLYGNRRSDPGSRCRGRAGWRRYHAAHRAGGCAE